VLIEPPRPVRLLDAAGRTVLVTERGQLPAPPATFQLAENPYGESGKPVPVTAWAGPWPVDERWWDPDAARQLARMQLVDAAGRAYLVCFESAARRWLLEDD
jgi:protein ImuB